MSDEISLGPQAVISVYRLNGCSGTVSLQYTTLDGTAVCGKDYSETKGTLTWAHGDVSPRDIVVGIREDGDGADRIRNYFEIEISAAKGEAIFDESTDGQRDRLITYSSHSNQIAIA